MSKCKLQSIEESLPAADARSTLNEVCDLIDEAIEDTRALSYELSPPIFHNLGLAQGIAWIAEHLNQKYGVKIDFEDDQTLIPLNDGVRLVVFTSLRELLMNVVKHAHAKEARIEVRKEKAKRRQE